MDSKAPMSIAPTVLSTDAEDIVSVIPKQWSILCFAVGVRESACNLGGDNKYSEERGQQLIR